MNPLAKYRERTREKLLSDFGAFCRRAWKEIEPGKPLEWSWHHEYVAEHLMLCYEREITRLIVTMPPRGLKSKLISVFFGAWVWAKSPHQSLILTSYSDSLSEELNMARRTLLQSAWFQQTFPGKVRFTADQNRREKFKNTAGGQSVATSVEGVLTGLGADYLLVDDILSPQQSYSDLERNNANRFFDSTLRSRLNDPMTGVIIIVCQRLHEADLVGHVMEAEPGVWTHVNLPLECEQDEEIVFPLSGRVVHRKQGELLHPQRWPKAWVEKQKKTVGPFIWSAQFQQRPAPAGGAIFKSEWFQHYKKEPDKGTTIISLDTAFSVKKTADYSAASVWTAHDGRYYLRFVWRERVAYPQLKAMVEELSDVWAPDAILIEEKASGQSLVQSLREETSLPIVGIPVDSDKTSRAHSVTALFSAGRVHFPEDAPWLPVFLHELELFPASAYDDQVDTTTQALRYLRSQQVDGQLTWIAVAKQKAEEWTRGIFTPKKQPRYLDVPGRIQGDVKETGIPSSCMHCGSYKLESCGTGQSTRLHCLTCGRYSWGELMKYPCPKCSDKLTGLVGGGKWRCNACGFHFVPGVTDPEILKTEDPEHVHRWRTIPGGFFRCDDCSETRPISGLAPKKTIPGPSRKEYVAQSSLDSKFGLSWGRFGRRR
jgi:predicted phage terminase large subunit-like protein